MRVRVSGTIIPSSGGYVVHFRSAYEGGCPDAEASLARRGTGCEYDIPNVASHDGHSPLHSTLEKAQDYRTRVLATFLGQMEGEIATVGLYTEGSAPTYIPPAC